MNVESKLARLESLLGRVRERRDALRPALTNAASPPAPPPPEAVISAAPIAPESDSVVEVSAEVVEVDLEEAGLDASELEGSLLEDGPLSYDESTLVRGWAEQPAPLPTRPSHGRMAAVRVPAPIEPESLQVTTTQPALPEADQVASFSDSALRAEPVTFGDLLDASLAL